VVQKILRFLKIAGRSQKAIIRADLLCTARLMKDGSIGRSELSTGNT
jgi:hypothetical protein